MLDVIIIGAGYGGMSTAALLARSGLKVVLIEKSPLIGGRANSYKDDEGYTWEYGAHSLRLAHKGIANQVFKRLGDEIQFIPKADDSKLIFKSRLWDRPEGPLGFLKNPMLSWKSRLYLLYLLIKIKKTDPGKWYDKTLLDFYRTSFADPELEEFLPFFGMTIMCPDPGRVSAGEVINFLQHVLAAGIGVGEPVGGSSQLFSKLSFHIQTHGEIRLNEKVTSIQINGDRAEGVTTDQANYKARFVVYAERLPLLFDLIDKNLFSQEFTSYCTRIEHSSSLIFDFITDYPVVDIRGSIIGVDIPVWARFQSNSDPSFTPHGKYISTWGILLPWGFDGDPEIMELTEKRLKITVSKIFPHLLPNLSRERKLIVPVMNGNVLTPGQSRPHRPSVRSSSIRGLYFAGDTVQGDGCSGDISFSSAMKVADCILAESS
jgi:phytoene dehydrogenase-like protein